MNDSKNSFFKYLDSTLYCWRLPVSTNKACGSGEGPLLRWILSLGFDTHFLPSCQAWLCYTSQRIPLTLFSILWFQLLCSFSYIYSPYYIFFICLLVLTLPSFWYWKIWFVLFLTECIGQQKNKVLSCVLSGKNWRT
jgi:hypothetical protein